MKFLIPLVFGFAAFVVVGQTHGDEPTVFVKLQGHVTWSSFPGGEVDGEVVVAGKMCLVTVLGQHFGPIPGDGQGKIVALDAATGKLVWEAKVDAKSPGPVVVWKNTVLFGSEEGAVYAVALDSGKAIWKVKIEGNLSYRKGSVVIGDLLAIVSHPNTADSSAATTLYMLNCRDGAEAWKQEGFVHQVAADPDGNLIVGSNARTTPQQLATVAAIDLKSRKQVWAFEPYRNPFGMIDGLRVDGENVYFATHNSIGDSSSEAVYAVSKADGKLKWKVYLRNNVRCGPFVMHGKVYVTDWSDRTIAVDIKTGAKLWSMGLGVEGYPLWDGVVLRSLEAYAMTAGEKNGKLVWQGEPLPEGGLVGNSHYVIPTLSDGKLYAVTYNNFVVRIE